MVQLAKAKLKPGAEQSALRRRVKRMYEHLNREDWEKCFMLVDPSLRERDRVKLPEYAESLRAFKAAYGTVTPWHVRLSVHLDATKNKQDPRPFAYVYVVWQDASHGFHMFRERWVRESDGWFTRVAGLVANGQDAKRAEY